MLLLLDENPIIIHLLIILLLLILEVLGYWGVHRAALLRGYETSVIGAVRDLFMFVPLFILVIWLSRVMRYSGNWIPCLRQLGDALIGPKPHIQYPALLVRSGVH